jgi:hypothetical protein
MTGYCKRHGLHLMAWDIKRRGCQCWFKQRKYGREVCKWLKVEREKIAGVG